MMKKDLATLEQIGEFDEIVPAEVGLEVKSPFAVVLLVGLGVGVIVLSWFAYNKFFKKGGR